MVSTLHQQTQQLSTRESANAGPSEAYHIPASLFVPQVAYFKKASGTENWQWVYHCPGSVKHFAASNWTHICLGHLIIPTWKTHYHPLLEVRMYPSLGRGLWEDLVDFEAQVLWWKGRATFRLRSWSHGRAIRWSTFYRGRGGSWGEVFWDSLLWK